MPLPVADRMANIGQETAFAVLAKARALEAKGRDVIHLQIGEPDFDTPRHILEAGMDALERGETHYSPGLGLPELRRAVAAYLGRTHNLDVDPDRVVITPGAKPLMFYAVLALINQGDEIIFPDPGYPIYP